jgi:hypothetical protein
VVDFQQQSKLVIALGVPVYKLVMPDPEILTQLPNFSPTRRTKAHKVKDLRGSGVAIRREIRQKVKPIRSQNCCNSKRFS